MAMSSPGICGFKTFVKQDFLVKSCVVHQAYNTQQSKYLIILVHFSLFLVIFQMNAALPHGYLFLRYLLKCVTLLFFLAVDKLPGTMLVQSWPLQIFAHDVTKQISQEFHSKALHILHIRMLFQHCHMYILSACVLYTKHIWNL